MRKATFNCGTITEANGTVRFKNDQGINCSLNSLVPLLKNIPPKSKMNGHAAEDKYIRQAVIDCFNKRTFRTHFKIWAAIAR